MKPEMTAQRIIDALVTSVCRRCMPKPRGGPAERLARSRAEGERHGGEIGRAMRARVRASRDVLPQQSIGVLVATALGGSSLQAAGAGAAPTAVVSSYALAAFAGLGAAVSHGDDRPMNPRPASRASRQARDPGAPR
jgi:hypothetical protein